jgi:hypothetical protein
MKHQNTNENAKSRINPPGFGVRALCAAFLCAPVCLGAGLWLFSRSAHFLSTLCTR